MVKLRAHLSPAWQRTDKDALQAQQIIRNILEDTLSADNAVRVAMINNPGLQGALTELGIAEADWVQAGKMRNPSYSFLKLTPVSDEYDTEQRVLLDVMSLITIPMRSCIEKQRFQQAKIQAAINILDVAAQTRKAYYRLIAAEQTVHYIAKVKETAHINSQLAKQLEKVGNFSKLQKDREQVFLAEIHTQELRAKMSAKKEREQLVRLLGLKNAHSLKLPERLPDLPTSFPEWQQIEKAAISKRLDIQMMQHELNSKAKSLGLTKATRFISVLEAGYAYNSSDSKPHQSGYEINLEIPLFDWGEAKVAKAQNIYMQSVWRLREVVTNAGSEIREAYQIYQMSYDLAKHLRDDLVPLRKRILDEAMLRYNGMLISTFELMVDEREQILSVNNYIEALRDFWLAQADMQTALMVKSPFN
ncbi:MAG: TolC family protein [Proteobacteria bacterium]|nr:TolC family protein [Pseudomonadota bacterium]